MSNNRANQYFETAVGMQNELTEEVLVKRMSECTQILGELANSQAWQIMLADVRGMIKNLDDKWQEMLPDSPQFKEARAVKMAFKHISDLPGKYLEELNMIEDKIKEFQNPDGVVIKDNDNN